MAQTINDLPQDEMNRIKNRLVAQIQSMNDAELRVVAQSQSSLAYFVAEAFRSAASLLGYVIALPIAWAMKIAENLYTGFLDGWNAAFKSAGME